MKKLLCLLIALSTTCILYAQNKPGTNLGKSFYTLQSEFPELRYVGSDSAGARFQDGYTEDGISLFFLIKNNIVTEECTICDSSDGFSEMWFNEMCRSFSSKWPYALRVNKTYSKMFDFGNFKVLITFSSERAVNRTTILYSM